MAAFFKALLEVLIGVFVGLLEREDVVDADPEPMLETIAPSGVDSDRLLDRFDWLLDED